MTVQACDSPRESNDPWRRLSRDQLEGFRKAIDAIGKRAKAELGQTDVRHLLELNAWSMRMEVLGRVLIPLSIEPLTFTAGVLCLWIHKQLQASEIGHTALHGAYDELSGAEEFHSTRFRWDMPIDEASWHNCHNIRHHLYTNVAGRDPDIHFGIIRLTPRTPHRWYHRVQLPMFILLAAPKFALQMNGHCTGLLDVQFGNGRAEKFDFIERRTVSTVLGAYRRYMRKAVPYYAKNYLMYPAMAGPLFWKVLLGNWLAERARDLYTAASVICGHVHDEVATYPETRRARGRGEWYAMQVEATNNFKVGPLRSILCGGLDLQIEHHLFPRLPPHRLREISAEVRAVCDRFGVAYRMEPWSKALKRALVQIARLS